MGFILTIWRSYLSAARVPIKIQHLSVRRRTYGSVIKPEDEEVRRAREWLKSFSPSTIPRKICSVSYSRSSGPGGQNVNKLNTKATLLVPLQQLRLLVPQILHEGLMRSRYMAERQDSLVIQSDESRKRSENVESCYAKLYILIQDTAKATIPGETSQDQIDRVKELKRAEKESRLRYKKMQSSKKSSRRGSRYDE